MKSCGCARRGGFDDLGFARLGPAVEDVVADRAVQQRRVLRDEADLLRSESCVTLRDVLPVDQDAPGFDVVEAQEQLGDRRLAGADGRRCRPSRRRDVESSDRR